jgi:hypothetical protein
MDRRRLGIITLIAGGALTVVGGVIWWRSRNSSLLGLLQSQNTQGGMTLKHYRSGGMPIEERVGIIQDMVWKSVQDPRMRKIALGVTAGCPARDGDCEARKIHEFVKANVRYTGDVAPVKLGRHGPVEGVDLFQSAYRTLEFKGGDCDDHSILNSTLLALNGISPKLRVTAPRNAGSAWQHIYALAGLPKTSPSKWKALDTTLPDGRMGTELHFGKGRDFIA